MSPYYNKPGEIWKFIKKDIKENWRAAVFMGVAVVILVSCCGAACLSQLIVGLPCPACGMTRAALLFFSGQWTESFRMHPFFYAVLLGVVIFFYERYCLRKKTKMFQYYATAMLVALIVFYVYRMVRCFPEVPPMTYREDNLLHRMLQMLKC